MKNRALTVAHKCKNLLASNWVGSLNTINIDADGSKDGIHKSEVMYCVRKGKPYIWVPEDELHNVNVITNERCSLAISSPTPGPLGSLLRSLKKPPARIALVGDVVALHDERLKVAVESLRDTISSEQKAIRDAWLSSSGIISPSNTSSTLRSESLRNLLDDSKQYVAYKFNSRSISYIDRNGRSQEAELENVEMLKVDPLSLLSANLIDGINQSEVRRRVLMLYCTTFFRTNLQDAYVVSVDRKGFDVLGKTTVGPRVKDGSQQFVWKNFRFNFKEDARDVEAFCRQLFELDQVAVNTVNGRGMSRLSELFMCKH